MSAPKGRPVVTVDPAVAFGWPHIKGVKCEAIASLFWAENGDADAVMYDYGLTRHELAVALWHEATHGAARREFPGWRVWADEVAYPRLAGWVKPLDIESLPLPPGREDAS